MLHREGLWVYLNLMRAKHNKLDVMCAPAILGTFVLSVKLAYIIFMSPSKRGDIYTVTQKPFLYVTNLHKSVSSYPYDQSYFLMLLASMVIQDAFRASTVINLHKVEMK